MIWYGCVYGCVYPSPLVPLVPYPHRRYHRYKFWPDRRLLPLNNLLIPINNPLTPLVRYKFWPDRREEGAIIVYLRPPRDRTDTKHGAGGAESYTTKVRRRRTMCDTASYYTRYIPFMHLYSRICTNIHPLYMYIHHIYTSNHL